MDVLMGVAPRQRREPSGLCVVEIDRRRGEDGRKVDHYLVRCLEHFPPGTSYPAMAKRCGEVAKSVKDRAGSRPEIYVEATGLGQPIVDEVERAGSYSRVYPVFFTHGDRRTQEGGEVRLGKGWVVCKLQMLLQSGQLHLPRSPEAETLAEELMEYEIQIAPDANDRYGAFRVGTRDELVSALGLAVQRPPLGTVEYARMPGFSFR